MTTIGSRIPHRGLAGATCVCVPAIDMAIPGRVREADHRAVLAAILLLDRVADGHRGVGSSVASSLGNSVRPITVASPTGPPHPPRT